MRGLGVKEVYQKLFEAYGNQSWWPAETPFEVCVGAVLTQNTSWSNVEKAIENLKSAGLLSPESILNCSMEILTSKIRPVGFYNQKARYLKNLSKFIVESGGLENLKRRGLLELRQELLSIKGIGRETADSILLYALERPIFVVDAYTKRLFFRLGLTVSDKLDYEEVRELVERAFSGVRGKTRIFNEFHALIVKHCKEFCKKKPLCKECSLKTLCRYVKIAP